MEDNGGVHYDGMKITAKKKRSSRRPRAEGSNLLTSTENFSKISSDDIPAFDTNPRRKEFSLRQCISRAESIAESERGNNNDSRFKVIFNRNKKRSTEGLLAPASWKNTSREDEGNDMINGKRTDLCGDIEEKTKKLKLKIGGVSRVIHANGSARKVSKPVKDTTPSNNDLEESSDDLEGVTSNAEMTGRRKQGEATGSGRKGKRASKKPVSDSDDDSDDEIRYLEKLKYRNVKPSGITNGENSSEKASPDMMDSAEEAIDGGSEIKRESTLTSRQRALASSASGKSSAVEFPDGLPPTSRRKKDNLTEMEKQLKKAEAAQKRKVQVEKAARESEAEAIRKILGQESSRKKREDKNKKRLEELAQEKAAHEERAATSYIRTIIGPNGTTVSFPNNELPSLFDPTPVRYPPPREKCAGPSCTNTYKYRHSKTNVPLCSLKCYKAVEEQQNAPPPA